MVSRENAVIVACMAVALAAAFGGRVLTDLSDTLLFGVLLLVGVLVPQLVNNYLDRREAG
jgi:hypothetical protein